MFISDYSHVHDTFEIADRDKFIPNIKKCVYVHVTSDKNKILILQLIFY